MGKHFSFSYLQDPYPTIQISDTTSQSAQTAAPAQEVSPQPRTGSPAHAPPCINRDKRARDEQAQLGAHANADPERKARRDEANGRLR